jgi:hypothetical protein
LYPYDTVIIFILFAWLEPWEEEEEEEESASPGPERRRSRRL